MVQRSNHVLVVDFGAQYAQLIARRVRQANVYSEIVPSSLAVEEILARNPRAIILSGGPSSVYAPNAPQIDPKLFETDIPIFGICYGFQAMAQALRGEVAKNDVSEFGRTHFSADTTSQLFTGLQPNFDVWMSHG
ncbi:MAG: GMP synthase (glutamine-hydrolyzing), partial [Actinobacteria bacterium]|nr:GMP synthase (glutamine-hydrolyzing) [Actinomycetota bacterium]